MVLPVLALVARVAVAGAGRIAGQVAMQSFRGASGHAGSGAANLTVSLSQNGAGIKRYARKAKQRVDIAALRATNKAGRWGRTRVRRDVAKLINVPQKMLRDSERRASSRTRPVYEYTLFRRAYPVRALRNVRFRAYPNQQSGGAGPQVGRLRFRAYGKTMNFERVLRKPGKRGPTYVLLPRGGRPATRVFGPWVKANYEGPAKVKEQLPVQFRLEFRRQMKLLRRR